MLWCRTMCDGVIKIFACLEENGVGVLTGAAAAIAADGDGEVHRDAAAAACIQCAWRSQALKKSAAAVIAAVRDGEVRRDAAAAACIQRAWRSQAQVERRQKLAELEAAEAAAERAELQACRSWRKDMRKQEKAERKARAEAARLRSVERRAFEFSLLRAGSCVFSPSPAGPG